MNATLWWLAQNTLSVAVMIPLVLVASRVFRDRPAVQHALWLLILVKFVTPPIVAWPWSAEQIQTLVWSPQVSTSSLQPTEPGITAGREGSVTLGAVDGLAPLALRKLEPIQSKSKPTSDLKAAPVEWYLFLTQAAVAVWLTGALACLGWQIRRIVRHAYLVRGGLAAPAYLLEEVAKTAGRFRMKPPSVILIKGILSPFIWCFGTLRMAWPDTLTNRADIERSRGIIAHELAHLHRRDHWIAWLELCAGVVWWWNPVFWFVRRRLRETAEMACDARAIAANPDSRREYAELLLELSSGFINEVPTPVLAVSAGTVTSFERRLTMILSDRVSGRLSCWGIFALLCFTLLALPHFSQAQPPAPTRQKRETDDNPKVEKETAKVSHQESPARDKQPFTAWGNQVGDLQVGVGYYSGEKRAYRIGETVRLAVRVRNVGKSNVKIQYLISFFIETHPSVKNSEGKSALPRVGRFGASGKYDPPVNVDVAPGEVVEINELRLDLKPKGVKVKAKYGYSTVLGTGKFSVQYERVLGKSSISWPISNPILSKLSTGKLELEVKSASPPRQDEAFTAWGKDIGGLQAGLGFHAGQKRAYRHGETAKLVLRVRNVSKKNVSFMYTHAFFIENSPSLTDGDGKKLPPGSRYHALGLHRPIKVVLAPGKEMELRELSFALRPASDGGNRRAKTLYGTGRIGVQYDRITGPSSANPTMQDPILSKLSTGRLELEVIPDPA